MIILGIETSCDDTSVCLLQAEDNKLPPTVLAHHFFSQEMILKKWGGVIPEIAARNHLEKLAPLLEESFKEAQLNPKDLQMIGVTTHPGLLGPLLTGLNAAKCLSLLYQLPLNPINHLFAHLEAIYLTEDIAYPYLGFLVSGGHSLYFKVSSPTDFVILGTTLDDAAGEAFDKGGKLMGLGYPAGALIDKFAKKGNPQRFKFPVGLHDSHNPNLSFSGVKTALRNFLEENPIPPAETQDFYDLCASYQGAIIKALVLKLEEAQKMAGPLPVVVGGGVACNSLLRQKVAEYAQQKNIPAHFVAPKYCTDNGAMIANYAWRTKDSAIAYPDCLKVDARGKYVKKQDIASLRD
ncbi:MAG: tRNA (adenosine(37)-N6)-threonylcarbamoyltransferase complex transferase subunit TsaD [Pseudomonadota bacterium]